MRPAGTRGACCACAGARGWSSFSIEKRCCRVAGEPRPLRRGKAFHHRIQQEWQETAQGTIRTEWGILKPNRRRGRIDIFVDDDGDHVVSVVEAKSSDWDAMQPSAVRRNALRHARQVWAYIESQLPHADVCPGIIYERRPQLAGRLEEVETILHEHGLQVVWHDETLEESRQRLAG